MIHEIHALLENQKRLVLPNVKLVAYFKKWREKRRQFGEYTEMEAFMAGYAIGNNAALRQKITNELHTEKVLDKRTRRTPN